MVHADPRRPGFQVMGNDYYGHNEKLLLPDGTMMYGEDVLGWYLITLRYYRRYYKPVMHTETSTPFPELNAAVAVEAVDQRAAHAARRHPGAGLHLVQPDRPDGLGHAARREARPRERLRAVRPGPPARARWRRSTGS